MTAHSWPFADAPDTGVFTHRQVVEDRKPILRVFHDAGDGAWQFFAEDQTSHSDATMVAFESIVRLDPSVADLADLPPGWSAWRESQNDRWIRVESD